MLKAAWRTFFSFVLPQSCELCGEFLPSSGPAGVCRRCEEAVPRIAAPHCPGCGRTAPREGARCGHCGGERFHYDRALACVLYESEMRELLHRFKFGRKRFLAPFFSRTMAVFAEQRLKTPCDAVLPVPMDKKRECERGFNQAALLSAGIAARLGRPHEARALGCRPAGTPQASLKKSERKANAEGRFFVRRRGAVAGRDLLLVDDVLTTGQTASSCAKALKEAGARSVAVLAFARGA